MRPYNTNMDRVKYDIKNGVWNNSYGSYDLNVSLLDNDWMVEIYRESLVFSDEILLFLRYKDRPMVKSKAYAAAKIAASKEHDKLKFTINEYLDRVDELTDKYMVGTVGEEVAFQSIMN